MWALFYFPLERHNLSDRAFRGEEVGLYFGFVLMGLQLKFVLLSFLWMDKPKMPASSFMDIIYCFRLRL
jgi:hypothetical protein